MLFKSSSYRCIPTFDFSSLAIHEKSSITNLGVKMDPSLKVNRHMQVEASLFLGAFS